MENGLKGDKRREENQLRNLIHCPPDNHGSEPSFRVDDAMDRRGKNQHVLWMQNGQKSLIY